MWKTFKQHPVVVGIVSTFALISAVVVFLAALANIWGAFSHETVPDVLAKRNWAMTLPPWQAIVILVSALVVIALQMSILREAFRRPYPTVMVFTHKVAEDSIYAFHIRDLFEKAGWRVELGATDLPQHAVGVWLHGGTSFEREMAKWGLSKFGVVPQVDYKDDKPASLQVIIGELNVAEPKTSSDPSFPRPTVEMLEKARQDQIAQIAKWRAMVTQIHSKWQESRGSANVRGLIEEHPDFPSLRARMTMQAKHIIEGTIQGSQLLAAMEMQTQSKSTFAPELRILLDEIARIEQERGLTIV